MMDTNGGTDQTTAYSVEEAEARATRLGLEAASQRGISKALFLSDCSMLVDNLCARASNLPMGARSVAMDILNYIGLFESCSFSHISRDQNCEADNLARAAHTLPAHMCLDPSQITENSLLENTGCARFFVASLNCVDLAGRENQLHRHKKMQQGIGEVARLARKGYSAVTRGGTLQPRYSDCQGIMMGS